MKRSKIVGEKRGKTGFIYLVFEEFFFLLLHSSLDSLKHIVVDPQVLQPFMSLDGGPMS